MRAMVPTLLAVLGGVMERGKAENSAQGPGIQTAACMLVATVTVTAILTGCKVPASAGSGGKSLGSGSVQCGLEVKGSSLTSCHHLSTCPSLFLRPAIWR